MTKTEVPLTIRRGKNSSVCDFSKQLREKKRIFVYIQLLKLSNNHKELWLWFIRSKDKHCDIIKHTHKSSQRVLGVDVQLEFATHTQCWHWYTLIPAVPKPNILASTRLLYMELSIPYKYLTYLKFPNGNLEEL